MMKRQLPTDPVACAIESALRPGHFISYNAGRSFITVLEAVEAQLKAVVECGQATQAIPYYELFIAACEEKANEIDDSANNFTDFAAGLFCGWVQAREAAGFDTTDTETRLLAWMEDDPWSFCYGLERHLRRADTISRHHSSRGCLGGRVFRGTGTPAHGDAQVYRGLPGRHSYLSAILP